MKNNKHYWAILKKSTEEAFIVFKSGEEYFACGNEVGYKESQITIIAKAKKPKLTNIALQKALQSIKQS